MLPREFAPSESKLVESQPEMGLGADRLVCQQRFERGHGPLDASRAIWRRLRIGLEHDRGDPIHAHWSARRARER